MRVTIDYPILLNGKMTDVRLTAECNLVNTGIGPYEYWGSREVDAGEDVIDVKRIRWDEFLYTTEENNIIANITTTQECYDAFVSDVENMMKNNF